MSEDPNSDLNPYAPPQTEVLKPKGSPQLLRKPKSTKWALAIFIFKLVVINWIHWSIVQEDGLKALLVMYQEDLVSLVAPVTSLLAFLGLILLGRSPIAYALGSLALVVLCNDAVLMIWREWAPHFFHLDFIDSVLEWGTPVIMVSFLVYLACRFIFGLPSRQYYKIAR